MRPARFSSIRLSLLMTFLISVLSFTAFGDVANAIWEPDTVPPVIDGVQPSGTSSISGVVISIDYHNTGSSDNRAIVSLAIDGYGIYPSNQLWPSSCRQTYYSNISCSMIDLPPGPHTITGSVTDMAGNRTDFQSSFTASSPFPYSDDIEPPQLKYLSPGGNKPIFSSGIHSIQVSADFSDPHPSSGVDHMSGMISLNGGEAIACSTSIFRRLICNLPSSLPRGQYDYRVWLSDMAGNTVSGSSSFKIGLTAYIRDDGTGGDCGAIGIWDQGTRTCTINNDYSDVRIVVEGDGIVLDGHGHTLSGNELNSEGITVSNSSGVTIKDFDLKSWSNAVLLSGGGDSVVSGSIIDSLNYGIRIENSSRNTVRDNLANSVFLLDSNDNVLENNQLSGHLSGFQLISSHNNRIEGNSVQAYASGPYLNSCGICLSHANGNSVKKNTLAGSYENISIEDSNTNVITENTAESSFSKGILIQCYDPGTDDCSNNQIIHNNFMNNPVHAEDASLSVNPFSLPLPIGGNYWSGWSGPDVDSDGIIDDAFMFDGGQDVFPWAERNGWTKPTLSLDLSHAYWQDYASYLERELSIVFSVANNGPSATEVNIAGTVCTAGVRAVTAVPLTIGNIPTNGAAAFTMTYAVPAGVSSFKTVLFSTAKGSEGDVFEYPGPFPGV
ncbi:MAG: NosD domain-containing protein [Thermoleophilia bacterium]|nr:NosD domain-containing protein [Thermoleophilia bacterium]